MLTLVAVHSIMADLARPGYILPSYQGIGIRILHSEDSPGFQVTLLLPGLTNESLIWPQSSQ